MTTLIGQRGSGFLYCCRTTLHDYAKAVNCELPAEGFVLPCKHCSSELVWTRGAWEVSNPNAWQMKQPTPQAEVERFERGQQITEGRLSGVMAEMGEGEPFVPADNPFNATTARLERASQKRVGQVWRRISVCMIM